MFIQFTRQAGSQAPDEASDDRQSEGEHQQDDERGLELAGEQADDYANQDPLEQQQNAANPVMAMSMGVGWFANNLSVWHSSPWMGYTARQLL
jgi:hypothetical protein